MIGGDDQDRLAAALDKLQIEVPPALDGIHRCLNARYPLQQQVAAIGEEIEALARERDKTETVSETEEGIFVLPKEIGSVEELEMLIRRLQGLMPKLSRKS